VKLLKSGLIAATYFYSKVDIGLIMNGQIRRSILSFPIWIAVLGLASAIPASAQQTKPLTWQERIDRSGFYLRDGDINQFPNKDFDVPTDAWLKSR
jgi:hypothetical protein